MHETGATFDAATRPSGDLSIDKVMRRIREVSTLPHIVQKVLEVSNDPRSSATDLCNIVETDPALTARLLKSVNSAAYGLRQKMTNTQRAISYLGFKQVRNLAISVSVAHVFKDNRTIGTYNRQALWRHMVYVAVCARLIAKRTNIADFDDVFLAGLLHDIGIILEDQYCHEPFLDMMANLPHDQTLTQTEQQWLSFDHTVIGARVAEGWKFPQQVLDAIRFHHMPENYRGEHGKLLCCVDLANIICSLKQITSVGVSLIKPSACSMERLGLDRDDVKVLAHDLDQEAAQFSDLLEL